MLAALVDNSLIARQPASERYAMLAVLAQHVASRATHPGQLAQALEAHSAYYAELARDSEANLAGGEAAAEAVTALVADFDNLRLAWQTALAGDPLRPASVGRFVKALFAVYQARSWIQEGYDTFAAAVARFEKAAQAQAAGPVMARLLSRLGRLALALGRFEAGRLWLERSRQLLEAEGDEAELALLYEFQAEAAYLVSDYPAVTAAARKSLALYERLSSLRGMAAALKFQAQVLQATGDYANAGRLYERGLALSRRLDDPQAVARALNLVANNLCELGQYEQAGGLYEESLEIHRRAGTPFSIALVLNNLGTVDLALKRWEQSALCFRESLEICREIGDQAGVAVALLNLGHAQTGLERYAEARQTLRQALDLCRRINYPYMAALTLGYFGLAALQDGDLDEAEAHYQDSIRTAMSIQAAPLAVRGLARLGAVLNRRGLAVEAYALALFALAHPAINEETRADARELQAAVLPSLSAEAQAEALRLAEGYTLEGLVQRYAG